MQILMCFHLIPFLPFLLAVCTNVIGSSVPPLVFFGERQRIYVEMYAEPQPSTHSPQVYIVEDSGNFTTVNLLEVDILRNAGTPLLTWVYLLDIPDIPSADSATLDFFVIYGSAHVTCSGVRSVEHNIPVVRSESSPGESKLESQVKVSQFGQSP